MGAQQELANAIDKILWEDWDPIGMKNLGNQRDEYSGYVAEIFSLALANASVEEIARRLDYIATNTIGFGGGHIERDKIVAEKILSIKRELIK